MSIACEAADSSRDEDLCPRVMDALERRRAALVSPVCFFLSLCFLSVFCYFAFVWVRLDGSFGDTTRVYV